MVMYIHATSANPNDGGTIAYTWLVGEDHLRGLFEPWRVVMVYADCDELDYVRHHMSNLPFTYDRKYVRWYGAHAQFIVGNLEPSA